jgi:hypothetical protein
MPLVSLIWAEEAAPSEANTAAAEDWSDKPLAALGEKFEAGIKPILSENCSSCHADGSAEGSFSLDALLHEQDPSKRNTQWHRVLKQLQADLMPPREEPQPSDEQVQSVLDWIKFDAFEIDPQNVNPGKVTVRRLNRAEYRNTIRDLIGVDYDTDMNFPADDTGRGFDNIGDVLSISPLLFEKYVDAANEIVRQAVPTTSRVVRRNFINGGKFEIDPSVAPPPEEAKEPKAEEAAERGPGRRGGRNSNRPTASAYINGNQQLEMSYYAANTARHKFDVELAGDYTLELDLRAAEQYVDNVFDLNKCQFTFSIDGQNVLQQEFVRQGYKKYTFTFQQHWEPGPHEFVVHVEPTSKEEQVRNLRLQVTSVVVAGPHDPAHFVKPDHYDRFFPREVPASEDEQRAYARELLGSFANRAFRRPADEASVDRLVDLTMAIKSSGKTFEESVANGMTAILASPKFLFREEYAEPNSKDVYPEIDQYSLASRLSYFLWSSMPDAELSELAAQGKLRENLDAQVARMITDKKAEAFFENFGGQWLQARAMDSIQINARAVLRREQRPDPEAENKRRRFRELLTKQDKTPEEAKEFEAAQREFRSQFARGPRVDLNGKIRRAMKQESEMLLGHVIRNDITLLDLLNGRYTFLNGDLAEYYEIKDIEGADFRKVDLPPESVRGGILTTGTFLAVTSNPDRTSPVKRGLYILENILGTPTGSPPPDIPALEESSERSGGKEPTLRDTLAIHRENAACASCHNRMDPLGLAFENFNALGRFRDAELGQPIDATGVLVTGESFTSVNELKDILASSRRGDFYRCFTEKLLTYALGRAVEYQDAQTIDTIVEQLEQNGGKAGSLMSAVISSSPFQRMQRSSSSADVANNP